MEDSQNAIENIKLQNWEISRIFNQAFGSIKLDNLEKDDKVKLIKFKIELGKAAQQIQALEKEAVDNAKGSDFEELLNKNNAEDATEEDKAKFAAKCKEVEDVANTVLYSSYIKEVEFEIEKFSESLFYSIADSLTLPELAHCDYIYNRIVQTKN